MTRLQPGLRLRIRNPRATARVALLRGPAGPVGEFINRFLNAWSAGTTYPAGAIVTRGGSTWLAIAPSTGVTPAAGPSWALVASAGVNGRGITDVQRTGGGGGAGSLDTYTITYSDGTTSTYQVRNGTNGSNGLNGVSVTGVARVAGTGAAGTTDTYRMTFSNGNTVDYTVVNGANGTNGRGFTPRGAWVSGTAYAVDDLVTSAGSTFRRVTAGAGTTAPVDGATWELWAAKGTDAAASAGGGALLGSARSEPGSANVATSTSQSPFAFDSNLTMANVVVPATGRLRVHLAAQANAAAAGGGYGWCVTVGGSEVNGSHRVLAPGTTYTHYEVDIILTGLAAGATVSLAWAHRFLGSSGTGRTTYGGSAGPATMEVYAA